MPLPLPNLADRSFDELMEEARSQIARYSREWTDYNPSDPGTTLLELFSWLGEMVMYRTNQVTDENYLKFLELIGITLREDESLEQGIHRAVELISMRYRAVTTGDYELLAIRAMEKAKKGLAGRAICLNNRDLDFSRPDESRPGHVSIFLIPESDEEEKYSKDGRPTVALRDEVKEYLNERRLITTRVHVSPFKNPKLELYKKVRLEAWLKLDKDAESETVISDVKDKLKDFLDHLKGGPQGRGWPLGRYLYRSELYQLLEGTTGVDHVVRLEIQDVAEPFDKPDLEVHIGLEQYQLIELDGEPVINVV